MRQSIGHCRLGIDDQHEVDRARSVAAADAHEDAGDVDVGVDLAGRLLADAVRVEGDAEVALVDVRVDALDGVGGDRAVEPVDEAGGVLGRRVVGQNLERATMLDRLSTSFASQETALTALSCMAFFATGS